MVSVAKILNRAADLIEKPGAWTQDAAARDSSGRRIEPTSREAVCWCTWGAIAKVGGKHERVAFDALIASLNLPDWYDPASFGEVWNDAPGRTQDEAVAALRDAAKKGAKPEREGVEQ